MISNSIKNTQMKQTFSSSTGSSPSESPSSIKGISNQLNNNDYSMSPFSISKVTNLSPPMSPIYSKFNGNSTKTPPLEMVSHIKEKIQHLGWIGTPTMGNGRGRQRSNTMAVDSPASPSTPFSLINTLEQVSKQLEEKEKDVQLAAEIGKLLLDKNSELETQVSQLSDYEKKYIDVFSKNEVLKNQNDTLSTNLKEATLVNELLVDKLNEANVDISKLRNQNVKKSSKKSSNNSVDIDLLQKELQDLQSKDLVKEKNIIKLKCDNESLIDRNDKLQNMVSDYEEVIREYNQMKEKYQYMVVKNHSLVSLAKDIATKKAIVDEYNMIKENFEVSLENILSNTSTIRSYNTDEEVKLLQEAKETLDKFTSDNNKNSVVLQLVTLLKSKEDISSNFLDDDSIDFTVNDVNEEDQKLYVEDQLAKQIEISTQNLSRSSILLLITLYISNKHRNLNDELNRNINSLSELQEDIKELTDKLQSNTKLNAKLEMDSLSNLNLIEELQQKTESLQNEIQSLQESYQKLENDKNNEIQSLQEELSSQMNSDKNYQLLEERYKNMEHDFNTLQDKEQSMNKLINELESSCNSYKEQLESVSDRFDKLSQEHQKLSEYSSDLKRELDSQITQNKEVHGKQSDWESKVNELLGEIQALKDKNSELISSGGAQVEKLSTEYKQSLSLLENQLADKESTIQNLQLSISDLNKEIITHKDLNQDLTLKLGQLELQMSELSKEKDSLINKLNEKINELNREILTKSTTNEDSASRITGMISEIEVIKKELEIVKEQLLEKSSNYNDLSVSHQALLENEKALSLKIREKDNEIDQLRQQLSSASNSHSNSLSDMEQHHQTKLDQLNSHIKDLENTIATNNHLTAQLNQDKSLLEKQLSDRESQMVSSNEDLQNKLNEYMVKLKIKEDENTALSLEIENLRKPKDCDQCQVHLDRGRVYQSQLDEFESQIERMKRNHMDELNDISKRVCLGCLEHNKTKKKCDELVDVLQSHKKQVEDMRSHLELLRNTPTECESCNNLRMELEALRRELEELKQSNQRTVILEEENKKLKNEMKKSQTEIVERESEFLRLQLEEQKKVEMEQSRLLEMMEENKQLEAKLALVTSIHVDSHECIDGSLSQKELEMVKLINEFLSEPLSTNCKLCTVSQLRDGFVFCNVVNYYISDGIDSRALHKPPVSQIQMSQNLNLILNSIKSYGADSKLTNIEITDGNSLFKVLFEIIYIGLLQRVSLKYHPELAYLWKHNPEKVNDKKESWDNFITLEPPSFIKRWINHFLKQSQQPCITDISQVNEAILINLISQLYSDSKVNDIESLMNYCRTKGCSIISSQELLSDSHSKLFFLAQLFDKHTGISLSMDKSIESDSPDISPTSEEKAAKQWLKTVDISAASLDDFRDGLLLLRALDQISPGIVNWKLVNMNPSNLYSMTENCNYCVKLGKDLRFSLVGIAGKDFVDGIKKFLLSFVWQMMRFSVLRKVNLKGKNGKDITESDLVTWANNTVSSAGMSTSIKSFSDASLKDSLFLLDLLESICKGCIDYSNVFTKDLDAETRKSNAKYVISVARRLGSTAIIFWEDIVEVKQNMIMLFILDLMQLI